MMLRHMHKVVTEFASQTRSNTIEESTTALQLVSKLLVLAISNIRELDVGSVAQRALCNQFIAALIFPHVVHPQCQCQNNCNGASHNNRDLGWDVIRRTLLREGKRSHDVAQTERD